MQIKVALILRVIKLILLFPYTGWVRIERIDGVGASQRGYWHVMRSTLGSAQAIAGERGPVRRPRLFPAPTNNPRNGSGYDDM